MSFAAVYLYLAPKLPEVETLKETKFQIPLRVYTNDGELIGEFGEKRRSPISFSEIPQSYIDAILSAEDDRFYSHNGVDLKGLLRAASQILQTGEIQGGGSTITMQVARNFFLSREQVFTRKFNEILLALQIERELTKNEILTLYINKIYLGNRAYGIQAAAQVYYGKNIDELNLAQIAMIAGLPKAPSAYNPLANPARAIIRRDWILSRMLELGHIDQPTYEAAVAEPITAKNHGSVVSVDAPYVAEMARAEMIQKFGLAAYTEGYRAYVTVDSKLQTSAQKAVINGLEAYDERHGFRGVELTLPTQEIITEQVEVTIAAPETSSPDTSSNAPDATASDAVIAAEVAAQTETHEFRVAVYDPSVWADTLQSIPVYADRIPAAITRVGQEQLQVLLAGGEQLVLAISQGFDEVRPFLSENRRGATYKTLTEFLKPGDVIRLKPIGDEWRFTQIPNAQGALVSMDPSNGAIRALVGGYDFRQSHFNRALQAARQPGSNFKPFIYSIALEQGFTPASIINDAPIVFDDDSLEDTWRPENSSGKFYGPTRLREALYNSRNLVSIRVLRSLGIDNTIEQLARFGFDTKSMPRDLSLALGSYALTPLKLATGYAVLANGGYQVQSYLLDRVILGEDEISFQARPVTVCDDQCQAQRQRDSLTAQALEELALLNADVAQPADQSEAIALEETPLTDVQTDYDDAEPEQEPLPSAKRVMEPEVNYLINSMLRDVIERGTGKKAKSLKRSDLAGKTGTTNGPTDAWFSGFNQSLVTTTWVGFDQNQLLGTREYGGSAALPIWIDYMAEALDGVPEDDLRQPNGIVSVKINPETGERARPGDPDAIFEVFRQEYAPQMDLEQTDDTRLNESIEELF